MKFHPLPLLTFVALIVTAMAGPPLLERALINAVRSSCPTCRLDIRRLRLHMFPTAVTFDDVRFREGTIELTAIDARAKAVYVKVPLGALVRGRWNLSHVRLDELVVDVSEGDGTAPELAEKPAKDPARAPYIELGPMEVRKGRFTYTRVRPGKRARLSVQGIDAVVDRFLLSPPSAATLAKVRATGSVESSGHFELAIEAKPFAGTRHVDVELTIRGQDLSRVNTFFVTEEGIHLRGEIAEAYGVAKIRGENERASVAAKYRNLDIDVRPSHKNSAAAALVMNFIASVKLREKNTQRAPVDRVAAVDIVREPKESIVAFVLRGLMDAAMRVASK